MEPRKIAAIAVSTLAFAAFGCDKKSDAASDTESQSSEPDAEAKQQKQAKPVEPDASKPETFGLASVDTDDAPGEVIGRLASEIEKSRKISMVGRANWGSSEGSEDSGPESAMLVFTNPGVEIPIVRNALTAGLELPQRLLVTRVDGTTRVLFNAPAYISKRHDIGGTSQLFVGRVEDGLSKLVSNAAGTELAGLPAEDDVGIETGQGLTERKSQNAVSETWDRLIEVVESNDDLELNAKFDFEVAAESYDKEIRPARLVVFRNPERQQKLVDEAPTLGLDLPHRVYVYGTKQGEVLVLFDDPAYLAERHGLDPESETVEKMDEAVKRVVAKATEEIE